MKAFLNIFSGNKPRPRIDLETLRVAAANGDMDEIRWLYSQGCEWDHSVAFAAAKYSHLVPLKYLVGKGCPYAKNSCDVAAANGDYQILKFLLDMRKIRPDHHTLECALNGRNKKCIDLVTKSVGY